MLRKEGGDTNTYRKCVVQLYDWHKLFCSFKYLRLLNPDDLPEWIFKEMMDITYLSFINAPPRLEDPIGYVREIASNLQVRDSFFLTAFTHSEVISAIRGMITNFMIQPQLRSQSTEMEEILMSLPLEGECEMERIREFLPYLKPDKMK